MRSFFTTLSTWVRVVFTIIRKIHSRALASIGKGWGKVVQLFSKANNEGLKPFHVAAKEGRERRVKLLLGRVNINDEDAHGNTALHWAAKKRKAGVVQLLLKRGADPYTLNNGGLKPFHVAAKEGHEEVARVFLDHNIDINDKDLYGNTALDWAVMGDNPDIVNLFLEENVKRDIPGKTHFSSLSWAAKDPREARNLSMNGEFGLPVQGLDTDKQYQIEYQLKRTGQIKECSKPNAKNDILKLAAKGGKKKVVELLLNSNVKFNYKRSVLDSALHSATENGHTEIANLLYKNGANPNWYGQWGKSAMDLASERENKYSYDFSVRPRYNLIHPTSYLDSMKKKERKSFTKTRTIKC